MNTGRFRILLIAILVSFVAPGAALLARPLTTTASPVQAPEHPLQRSFQGELGFPFPNRIAQHGCAMAHCNRAMSDNAAMMPPLASSTSAVWRDTVPVGSEAGLGCSSNGKMAVCTFTADLAQHTPTVKAYSASGRTLWSSSLLNGTAYASAPIMDPRGDVIVADSERVVRFDASGNMVWNTPTPGGIPISPNITDNGAVILTTLGGPISAYDVQTGEPIGQLVLADTVLIAGKMRGDI